MADKWWDISDDDLDELFRVASDKVDTPFDPSALVTLKSKMSGTSGVSQESTWKRWAWIPLLLLLMFSSGVIYRYYSSDNQGITQNSVQQSGVSPKNISTIEPKKDFNTNQQKLKIGETTTNSGKGEDNSVEKSSPNSVAEIPVNNGVEKLTLPSSFPQKMTVPVEKKKVISSVEVAEEANPKTISSLKSAKVLDRDAVYSSNKSYPTGQKSTENLVVFTTQNSQTERPNTVIVTAEYGSLNELPSEKSIQIPEQKTDFNNDNFLKIKEFTSFSNQFQLPNLDFSQENIDEVKPIVPLKTSRFGIRLAISPDINSVEKIGPFAVGSSMGILLEYRLGKRLVLQTGLTKSKKNYESDVNAYHAWRDAWKVKPVQPTSVEGSCSVLDVPINLRYNLGGKRSNNWFVSGGISSYLMMSESYSWYFANQPSYEKQWADDEKYYWSTLNLSFGLEKSLTRHISFQAEPYLKAPLSLVGRGKVNIFSSGILFSAKYGF